MPSAFEYDGKVYWTSREMLEHFLRRGAELAAARLGAGHPAAAWLAANKDAAVEGGAFVLDGRLPLPDDRAALAGVLEAVGAEGLEADAFDASGAAWVKGDLARLASGLRGARSRHGEAEEAAKEPFPSRKILVLYGAGSMVLALFLFAAGELGFAEIVFGLGAGAFVRAFWLSYGLDPDERG